MTDDQILLVLGTFLISSLFGWILGNLNGRHREAAAWRRCTWTADDHMRSDGRDYKVLSLDTFYRDYHNAPVPIA